MMSRAELGIAEENFNEILAGCVQRFNPVKSDSSVQHSKLTKVTKPHKPEWFAMGFRELPLGTFGELESD